MNAIFEYYQKIKDGTIAVGKWIDKWYSLLVQGLENKDLFFDAKKADIAIKFIENFCRHHEGELGGKKIKLELWQKALISVLFGVVDKDGLRQFRECLIVVGRKNGKTLLAAAIAAYMSFLSGEYGARVYFAAPKLQQANLCFDAFYQMIEKEPLLSSRAKKRRTDIYIAESNTSAQPLAFSEKKSDGLNCFLVVADEVSSWAGDGGLKFYEVLKSSFGARREPLLLNITTAGYVDNGIYDELFKRATRVLKGDSEEKRLAPFIYQIDDAVKWNDINELQKSNPNLGVSVSVNYLLDEITVAEGSLSKRAEFLSKYCNIKQNSSQAWLSAEAVKKACGNLNIEDYRETYCTIGIDLSRTTDLTAAVAVIEKNGVLNVFSHFWLPAEKLEEATARDNLPYAIYAKRGFLSLSGENIINYQDCYEWVLSLVRDLKIYPLMVGYDRYCAQYLIEDIKSAGLRVDDVYQGFNLSPVIKEFEGLLKDGKISIGDNDLLKIHFLNSALKMDNETEKVKLVKLSKTGHIDGMAALLDALTVRQKWYGELGEYLKNGG